MTWLQRRAQEIKKSWERILLEELFVFSGGLEGAWVTTSPGWIPGKELHHNDDRAGVTFGRGRVVGLQLGHNGLVGVLSPSCGLFSKLRVLDLSGNSLKGTLDPICALRSVEIIDLSSNMLSGTISDAIGSMTTLQQLFLSNNKLTGSLPGSLSSLSELSVLCLANNTLTGVLPRRMAALSKLSVLAVQGNRLKGPLAELDGLTALRSFESSGNRWTGDAPSLRTLSGLRVFACQGPGYGRGLSGGLHDMFKLDSKTSGKAMQLVRLDLSCHALDGGIPVGLRALRCLEILILFQNKLSGRLPAWLGELRSLRHVDLHANLLEGSVPSSLAELPHLDTLLLEQNALDGELPPKLAAIFQCGGRRFSFDGNSNTCHRRQTAVEYFMSPQVSETLRKGEGTGHQKSNANGIEENCVAMLKEPKRDACFPATGIHPRVAGQKPPRTGRRGTEIL